jgi:hypothetical protein
MRTKQSWTDIEFSVGRYFPRFFASEAEKKNFKPYKEDKSRLKWNVFNESDGHIKVINLFDYNYTFLTGLLEAKRKYKNDFSHFADKVRTSLQHCFWSKCEYETIITTWPPYIESEEIDRLNKEKIERLATGKPYYRDTVNLEVEYKIDIYTQVMMNWDRFIDYIWTNKHLITKKKLGLDR